MFGELIAGLMIGVLFTIVYEGFLHFCGKPQVRIKGHHIHHSILGLILIVIFLYLAKPFILGSGLGVIIRHTYDEKKFTFIEKD